MKKTLAWLCGLGFVLLALTACGSGSNSDTSQPTGTLPAPQVRIEVQPSATPLPPDLAATETASATEVQPTAVVQALPTLDEEQYYQDQIEGLLNKIETNLNTTDTNIKP